MIPHKFSTCINVLLPIINDNKLSPYSTSPDTKISVDTWIDQMAND